MQRDGEDRSRIYKGDVKRAVEGLFENRFEYVHPRQVMACDGWEFTDGEWETLEPLIELWMNEFMY